LSSARLTRLQEHTAILGAQAYTIDQLLSDLTGGILSELKASQNVDPYRRNLQRAYIDVLGARLSPAPAAGGAMGAPAAPALKDDSRGAIRAELKTIQMLLADKSGDQATKNHWADLADQITQILEPKK
jgi:hypothetical protein